MKNQKKTSNYSSSCICHLKFHGCRQAHSHAVVLPCKASLHAPKSNNIEANPEGRTADWHLSRGGSPVLLVPLLS